MGKYILHHLILLIPVLLGVSFLTFAIAQVTPGDPVALMLGQFATPERLAELREQLGYNDPFLVRYVRYVWHAARGDLGTSVRGQMPVLNEILARLGSTLELTVAAMIFAVLAGLAVGIVAATARHKWVDSLIMGSAVVGLSIPDFWLAILLIIVFGVKLKWVAVTGGTGLRNLILPAFCLGLGPAAMLARMTRSSILEVIRDDYVRTARAKGLNERSIIFRHVLRNALIPVVTVTGLMFASLLGGAVFIESVFARPGLGRFAVSAIAARDYPQVQGLVLFGATVYVLVNLVVDILYALIDPRIRLK